MTDLTHEPVAFSRWSGPRHVMSPPPAELVVELQAPTTFPAITLLLPTTAGSVMTPQDRVALRGLLDQARQRLYAGRVPAADDVLTELARVAEEAMTLSTASGLAVLTSRDGIRASIRLPVAVVPRVVVDASFATRDLVRALHRTPRHAVLALGSRQARLFEGAGDELRPVTGRFPITAAREQRRDPDRPGLARSDAAAFYRDVDAALGAHLRLHPSPIVLAGSPRAVAGFRAVSRHLARLAGTVEADVVREPLPSLARRVRPVLEQYLRSRQEEALDLLERRMGSQAAVSGVAAAWLAARHERPEMLVVDESLVIPARLSPDGDFLEPAEDPEALDVVDDIIDELIELVLRRGGWIALAEPGRLTAHDGVALTLRTKAAQ